MGLGDSRKGEADLIAGRLLTAERRVSSSRLVCMGFNALVAGLWLWLYRPVFDYLSIIFSRDDFRTNQVALVSVLVLIAWRVYRSGVRPRLEAMPQLSPPALALALGGSVLYLLAERFLDVNTLAASIFGLASYGLLGLWMHPRRWREGLPAALLLIGTLPFGEHMQTFVGYPFRVLTAAIVRDGLQGAGVTSVGVDTILVFENGISLVDLPCSGVKSLWTGMLFLVAATWVERRPLNLRWFLTMLAFTVFLFIANVVRVAVLVVVGEVAGWRLMAEMLHVPLGVLGFVGACAMAVGLLRLQRPIVQEAGSKMQEAGSKMQEAGSKMQEAGSKMQEAGSKMQEAHLVRPVWLAPALAVVILAMVWVYTPRPQVGLAQAPPGWEFPADLVVSPEPLKPNEVAWLTRDGAASAERLRFEWRGSDGTVHGSLMLITSATWRAHHRPERCFEVYGLVLNESRVHLVTPDFPLRFISLGDDAGRELASASYWFQSAGRTTADYGTRIWADLSPERERWVLVTILFDGVRDPRDPDVQALYVALHEAVASKLNRDW